MQDLGIWAYRILSREGGIDQGSAVGLVKKLQTWEVSQHIPPGDGVPLTYSQSDKTPGVIVLNPGQLLYSPELNKSTSQATWLARPRETALADSIRINNLHNKVSGRCAAVLCAPAAPVCVGLTISGHTSPAEHISTFFQHILPRITQPDAHLYLVGIGGEAEPMLACLDRNERICKQLQAIALMQPSHPQLQSEALIKFMKVNCKSYIIQSQESTDPDPYADEVSCPTFSAGPVDVVENIWPQVMEEVLPWFASARAVRL